MRPIIGWRGGTVLALALALSACGDASGGSDRLGGPATAAPAAPALPGAAYLTEADHFAELQRAALTGDYPAFADHLRAGDPQAVVAQLQDAFGGGPFDVYTLEAETGAGDHRRVAELRGPSGRLYLYFELDRADGGWTVGGYELSRDRSAVLARL